MKPLTRYIVKSSILSAGAAGLVGLAFFVAVGVFSATPNKIGVSSAFSPPLTRTGQGPNSHLAGAHIPAGDRPTVASSPLNFADREWVKVTHDVNMRNGPTRSSVILEVKAEGTRLQVASRDGSWIEVLEPETGEKGWIYEKFLQESHPNTHEAELTGVSSR
jgi:hypothetical protein